MKVKVRKRRVADNSLPYINANLNSIVTNQNLLAWQVERLLREIRRVEKALLKEK